MSNQLQRQHLFWPIYLPPLSNHRRVGVCVSCRVVVVVRPECTWHRFRNICRKRSSQRPTIDLHIARTIDTCNRLEVHIFQIVCNQDATR